MSYESSVTQLFIWKATVQFGMDFRTFSSIKLKNAHKNAVNGHSRCYYCKYNFVCIAMKKHYITKFSFSNAIECISMC